MPLLRFLPSPALLTLLLALLQAPAATAQLLPDLGGQRAGISALTFLKIDVSPRAAALGGASVALTGDPTATQWNPAALTDLDNTAVGIANTFWVDEINLAFASVSHPFPVFGTAAFHVRALSSGPMERRTELQPNGTGEIFYATNVAAGFTYAKQLTGNFSFGITGKYVNETLDNFTAHTGTFDLGFAYRTDVKDLRFAVAVKDFGPNSEVSGDNERLVRPLTGRQGDLDDTPAPMIFNLGASIVPIKNETHRLLFIAQLNQPNDNSANIRLGAEYSFHELFFFRAGYKINVDDQPWPTTGIGLRTRLGRHPVRLNYGVDPMPYLGIQHRIGLSLQINRAARTPASSPDPDA